MTKILPVKWHTQRNNKLSPFATCNATSIATVMQWLNCLPADYNPQTQLDDYVTQQLNTTEAWDIHKKTLDNWNQYLPRNNHFVLKWYIEKAMPVEDRMIVNSLTNHYNEIRTSITNGMPVICAGYYSVKRFNGQISKIGHINVIVGFTDASFIFCDPYGDATTMYLSENGDHVEYPYSFCLKSLTLAHILSKV